MLSRVAGACLPTVAAHRVDADLRKDSVNPSQQTIEATPSWFDGRNLFSGKPEQKAVIT